MLRSSIVIAVLGTMLTTLASGCASCGGCVSSPKGGVGKGACRPGLLECLVTGLGGCNAGCGEVYWNEWFSDPPDPCDPCDWDGCYTGNTYCNERIVHWPNLGLSGGKRMLNGLNGGRFAHRQQPAAPDPHNIHGSGPTLAQSPPAPAEHRAVEKDEIEPPASNVHWAAWPTANSR